MAEDVIDDNSEWNVRLREDEEMDFFTELALHEAERWIQAVTRKKFEYPDDFRKSLSNGVLLCDLLNGIKPGSVKRINKLSGAIAGLDNINVFLTSCERNFGLNQTQLFDPADLEDLSQRAIADENEELLRQEVNRRAINVAVTIFWLGKSVAGKYKGPLLDTSAFSALVHSHGNKNVISDDRLQNHDNWNQDEIVKQTNPDTESTHHRHARDSSYDSLGSYERESECSFDELEGSNGIMPVRSDMRGDRRYGSTSSLSRNHELRLSAANDSAFADDKHDSMYQSSPDLSQGSHAHTRSSSTDSMDGSYHGNHSRQSSGSADNYPTRRSSSSSAGRKSSTSDPLQFVKISKVDKLAEEASQQIRMTEEANKMRGLVETGSITEEPDWQSNFEGWKNRRRKSTPLTHAIPRIGEAEGLFGEESKKGEQATKTYSQMMEEKNKRKSLGAMHFYPIDDEFDGVNKSEVKPTASASPQKEKPKEEAVAPWARDSSGEGDSQSDSETNQSHQSGDTDSVFSDKSAPNKVLSDDDSWVKNNSKTSSHTNVTASKDIPAGKGLNVKSWENSVTATKDIPAGKGLNAKSWENSVQASAKKNEKKSVDLPSNSANKIKNLTQSYEKKEKAAHEQPAIQRRSDFSQSRRSFDFGSKSDSVHPWKSTDLSVDKSQNRLSMPESSLLATSPKALLPKSQRYSSSSPVAKNTFSYSPPAVNTKSFSASPRSRYIDSLTPPHTPKSSPLTTGASAKLAHKSSSPSTSIGASAKLPPKPSPPPTLAKPPRGKLSATISKFESAPDLKKTNSIKDKAARFENQLIEGSKDIEKDHREKVVDNISTDISKVSRVKGDTDINGKSVAEFDSAEKRLDTLLANDSDLQKDDQSDFQTGYQSFPIEQTVARGEINDLTAERNPSEDVQEYEGDKINKIPENEADLMTQTDEDIRDNANTDAPINTDYHLESVPTKENSQMTKDIQNIQELRRDATWPLDHESNRHPETFPDAEWRANGEERSGHNIPDVFEGTVGQDIFPPSRGMEVTQVSVLEDDAEAGELQDDCVAGDDAPMDNKKFVDKTIKISQKANNSRGFGFTLVGGAEKKQPVTVQRVNLESETSDNDDVFISDSSAADVCEVEVMDTILRINGRDVEPLTLAQVQGIIDHSVKRGQIELIIRRYQSEEEEYDSMEEEEFSESAKTSNNNNKAESDTSSLSTDITSEDTPTYKPAFMMSTRSEDNSKPRIMDQLMRENDAKNNQSNQVADKPPSPMAVQPIQADISFSSHMTPTSSHQEKVGMPTSTHSATSITTDTSSPDGETITEERATMSAKKSPANQTGDSEYSPVVMRRKPASTEKTQKLDQPSPPILPRAEPPPLPKSPDTSSASDDSSFGPPAALLRWQRGRAKSEYQSPLPRTSLDEQLMASKRLSSTLPYQSDKPLFDSDYSKDDSALSKASKDSKVSKSFDSKRNTFHFDDSDRLEAWQDRQEQERQNTPPPVEVAIQRVESLTPQNAAPNRKVGQVNLPSMMELNIPSMEAAPLSPQEKFERDQQRIRQQFEEEKRHAQEIEKKKKDEEQRVLNQDKFMKNMESQIIQTKLESTNQSPAEVEPIRPAVAPPRFSSEPMTIRLPGSRTEGRHLVIDPRNQGGQGDAGIPEYSFHVELKQSNNSAPPLRTLAQATDSEQLERERIREEEKEKIRQEMEQQMKQKQQELDQKQEQLRREQERLKQEQERVAQEKAQLEQRRQQEEVMTPRYQTASFQSPRSSSSSAHSPLAHSPHSPHSPPALNPKHREPPMPRKMDIRVPPPTAPKPDRKEKGRLTREDLMAMNRKATPMTNRPEGQEATGDNEHGSVVREAPSKNQLHSLNAVPKQKFRNSAAWIKDEEEEPKQAEQQFVIGSRSDVIHKDYSNPDDHWLIREAEKRRLAEQREKENRFSPTVSVTARAGPTKPSESSLVSRFRGDVDPVKRNNRYSYPAALSPDSHRSTSSSTSRPLSSSGSNLRQFSLSPEPAMTQFSAKTQPNSHTNLSLTQTLPPNFSFNANNSSPRKLDLHTVPSKPPLSSQDDGEQMIAVSGKQTCSHCGEELEGLKYSKV